jgi:isoamylase
MTNPDPKSVGPTNPAPVARFTDVGLRYGKTRALDGVTLGLPGERPRMKDWTATEGTPFPLGATWVEEASAWNFALYSKDAESVTLLLYGEADLVNPVFTYRFDYLRNKSGRIWHCRVAQAVVRGARYYGYSVAGPEPQGGFTWHCFDPDKVLLDPYAKAVFFPPAFDRAAAARPGSNASKAPLGVLADAGEPFDWGDDRQPRHQSDTVIYELHVRGFTNNPNSGVSPDRRGTYSGVIDKIPYLKELGITAVELMPVFQYDPQEGSCWGYMPLNFFTPHDRYSSRPEECDQHDEFRAMVKALHAADIEVILDVVYNHTAEGEQDGPVYSYKGIDNSTYYLLSGQPGHPYVNFSGTGNTLRGSNPCVRKMIVDSARYWIQEMHVDGFRFDLASALARNDDGSLNTKDPIELAPPDPMAIRLIAEPWDAAGAYLLGRSFPSRACLQWNGRFRDDVRRFVRGDPGMVPALMQRLYGSDDLFPDDRMHAFHAYQSINYVTAHDGFTLYDLVSYDRKRNEANGHNNTDGPEENYSWNCGWEGDDGVPACVLELRKRQAKNFCCLLLLANGTPMFRAGDEFLQTQGGNNNPYNQDNATSWLNWDRLPINQDVFRFFRCMIAFRKAHPSLGRSRFWREDVRWYGTGPTVDMGPDSRTLAFYLCGAPQQDTDLYVMINASESDRTFEVQEGRPGEWQLAFDTGLASPDDFPEPPDRRCVQSSSYVVHSRSVAGMIRHRPSSPTHGLRSNSDCPPVSRKGVRHDQP